MKELNNTFMELFNITVWAISISFTVYAGIAGMDEFENKIYNLIESFI